MEVTHNINGRTYRGFVWCHRTIPPTEMGMTYARAMQLDAERGAIDQSSIPVWTPPESFTGVSG